MKAVFNAITQGIGLVLALIISIGFTLVIITMISKTLGAFFGY